MKNSIYGALENINSKIGLHSDKLAIAYVHSLLKNSINMINSNDPLVEEASHVYVALDTIGINTLDNSSETYMSSIKDYLSEERRPLVNTVEEVLLKVLEKNGLEKSMNLVGKTLTDLLSVKPCFDCDPEKVRPGNVQKYEQRAIKNEFSKFC